MAIHFTRFEWEADRLEAYPTFFICRPVSGLVPDPEYRPQTVGRLRSIASVTRSDGPEGPSYRKWGRGERRPAVDGVWLGRETGHNGCDAF